MKSTTEYTVLAKIKEFILDFLYPVQCLNCSKYTNPHLVNQGIIPNYICKNCFEDIYVINNNHCLFCKAPSYQGITCPFCKSSHNLDQIIACFPYNNKLIQRIIKTLK